MSIDFADVSSLIDSNRYLPTIPNLHYCQWIFYNHTVETNNIIQIDLISDVRKITLNKGREVNNPLFKDWGFDMNFYNECGNSRFCNAYHVNKIKINNKLCIFIF